MSNGASVGVVETSYYTFASLPEVLTLESDQHLDSITLAYETYGKLNAEHSNAILVEHALTGDAHAAGLHGPQIPAGRHPGSGDAAGLHLAGQKPGWWDDMIGPGKAFDTDKYFVICSNIIGGCKGSTGPASIDPKTGKPYGLKFPVVTIKDMVEAQRRLIDHLGIDQLLSVVGGSMGGMQALQWAASYPDRVRSAIPIATTMKHSPQQIALGEVGRQAIMADPAWLGGDYYGHGQPERGLALARMIGHITYMSDQSMEEKFSRRLSTEHYHFSFDPEFEVEGYLRHRGASFVRRFDANSYLYVTKAMDYLDLSNGKLIPPGANKIPRFMVIAFKSDWLYPSYQSREIVSSLRSRHADVTYCEINSTYGHDAFLLEFEEETRLISHFLEKTFVHV